MRDVLPGPVYAAIGVHLRRQAESAPSAWLRSEEDEDSLTGELFASLATARTQVTPVNGERWQWRITSRKFGGRGGGAPERVLGADGIIQVELLPTVGVMLTKGLLFQAKKQWSNRDARLLQQVVKMEALVPGGCAVIDYRPDGYRAVDGSTVVQHEGRPSELADLGSYLAERFMACAVGLRHVYFDARRKVLVLPPGVNQPDAMLARIRRRLRIEVRGPEA